MIKLRKREIKELIQREMAESFESREEIYRYRGLVEGAFGEPRPSTRTAPDADSTSPEKSIVS